MKATYNKSKIFRNAWYLKRANASMSFSACLKKAWRNADKRAFNTSHSCNSSCIVFILFPLLHLDKFAAMRTGDCVCRLRGEKITHVTTNSGGNTLKHFYTWIPINMLAKSDGRNSHFFGHFFNS